jgi:hypothetical protein
MRTRVLIIQAFVHAALAVPVLAGAQPAPAGARGATVEACIAALADAARRVKAIERSAQTCAPNAGADRVPAPSDDPVFRDVVLQQVRAMLQPLLCEGSQPELSIRPPNTVVIAARLRQLGARGDGLAEMRQKLPGLEFDLSEAQSFGYCSVAFGEGLETVRGSGGSPTAKIADVTEAMQARLFEDSDCPQAGPRFASAVRNPADVRRGFWVRRPQFDDLAVCRQNQDGQWAANAFNRNVQNAFIVLRGER